MNTSGERKGMVRGRTPSLEEKKKKEEAWASLTQC